jgi:hypothetical protein
MVETNKALVKKIEAYIERLIEKARKANPQIPPMSKIKKIKLLSLSEGEKQKGNDGRGR